MAFFDKLKIKKNKTETSEDTSAETETKSPDLKNDKESSLKETSDEPDNKSSDSKKNKVWHITKRSSDGMWQVKGEGAAKATKLFRTKAEAEEYVKTLLSNNEGSRVVSHKKDGKYQKKK